MASEAHRATWPLASLYCEVSAYAVYDQADNYNIVGGGPLPSPGKALRS